MDTNCAVVGVLVLVMVSLVVVVRMLHLLDSFLKLNHESCHLRVLYRHASFL
jgi:hypothetical protein